MPNSLHTSFQSTPAIAGGRIRASTSTYLRLTVFQSTPAIAGGRILNPNTGTPYFTMFQSTPAIAGGRIPFARNALPRNGFCWYLREPGGTVLCFA